MSWTEKQAKGKWCPFARAIHGAGDSVVPANRFSDGRRSSASQCIGSACMGWRWIGAAMERGYCGLAGRPEVMSSHFRADVEAPEAVLTSFGARVRKVAEPSRG